MGAVPAWESRSRCARDVHVSVEPLYFVRRSLVPSDICFFFRSDRPAFLSFQSSAGQWALSLIISTLAWGVVIVILVADLTTNLSYVLGCN